MAAPEGMAWRLEAGSDLLLKLHLLPSGKPEVVRCAVGFYFTEKAPTRIPLGLRAWLPYHRHSCREERLYDPRLLRVAQSTWR